MREKIRNRFELLSHGDVRSRRIVLDITERVLQELDGCERIKSMMSLNGDVLEVGNRKWDLHGRNVYLVGAGKACNAMAMAVDEILGDRLTDGVILVKIKEETDRYRKTRSFLGGHPLPNREGVEACLKVLDLVERAKQGDLFIAVFSGGSSALMGFPVEGISLEEKILTSDILVKSGASVLEINAVRRHISRMNGGRLAQRIGKKGADLIGISIHDMVGLPETGDINEPVAMFGTPIGPDETTLEDARRVIRDYNLEHRLPASVVRYINSCGPEGETPKRFERFTYYRINTLPDSCRYAAGIAAEMGLECTVLTTFLEGESKDAGTFLASIAQEIQENSRPVKPPCVVLCAGETVTRIPDNSMIKGHGGPSQEMVLSYALTAAKTEGTCLLSIDTEGTDGSTLVAGGIADSQSLGRAVGLKVNILEALRDHASYEALKQMGDTVVTGNTGTNVCDFNIMYVPAKKA